MLPAGRPDATPLRGDDRRSWPRRFRQGGLRHPRSRAVHSISQAAI